jgi:hypothetical protein
MKASSKWRIIDRSLESGIEILIAVLLNGKSVTFKCRVIENNLETRQIRVINDNFIMWVPYYKIIDFNYIQR